LLSPSLQHTLAGPAFFAGPGIHSGVDARVIIRPALPGTGIVFVRSDVTGRDNRIAARADAVCHTRLGTVIGNQAGATVSTIEHLMAALCALCVDNAVVEIDGPEVPIMDGSAAPFLASLDLAGRRAQQAPRRYLEICAPVTVKDDGKSATLIPAERFEVAFEIFFDTPAIGRQKVDVAIDEAVFRGELADCRTFGFLTEVEALRAGGFARGGTLDNVVVIDGDAAMNPDGFRRPDECVRHKAVDAIGDLYLLGAPLIGRYEGLYAGHGLNNALARALLAAPEAWRLAPLRHDLAQAV
jgi:UDP-3-O-[3-hydroxymyristoyl] N-acetylglucosamine deacetylase